MKLPKIEVDATNMRLVFDIEKDIIYVVKDYSDWLKNKTIMENHMNWEIVNRYGEYLGVADYDTILGIFGSVNG